jgi:hypothetical protein
VELVYEIAGDQIDGARDYQEERMAWGGTPLET